MHSSSSPSPSSSSHPSKPFVLRLLVPKLAKSSLVVCHIVERIGVVLSQSDLAKTFKTNDGDTFL